MVGGHKGDGIEFVDLSIGPEYYFALDDHMSKLGHEKIAAELAALLGGSNGEDRAKRMLSPSK